MTNSRVVHPRMLKDFDVMVQNWPCSMQQYELQAAFQATGGKTIVEFDDNVRDLAWCNPAKRVYSPEQTDMALKIMGAANAATTSTQFLKDEFRDVQPNTFVCHNALDPNVWSGAINSQREEMRETAIRIGWAGTTSQHYDDLDMVRRPIVRFLKERKDARFIIATENPALVDIFPKTVKEQIIWAGSTFEGDATNTFTGLKMWYNPGELLPAMRMPDLLRGMDLDIAIAPIVNRPYSLGKSWLKVLEYGAAGYPVLASGIGPYAEYDAEYDGTIALVARPEDWYERLVALADDAEMRSDLQRRNRMAISMSHMITQRLSEWQNALSWVAAH